eukprot:14478339-Alexandrium_andersonii.AAC.1
MLVMSVQLGLSRRAVYHYCRVAPWTTADPLHRGSLESLRAAPNSALYYRRRCFCAATWGAAKRRPKSLRQSAVAHSTAPVPGRL